MASLICPICKSHSTFTRVFKSDRGSLRVEGCYDAAFQCHNPDCTAIVGAVVEAGSRGSAPHDYWPRFVGGKQFPDVPDSIAAAADEAHKCLSIGAVRAAVGMARAVVEATAKDNGVKNGNLESKIKELVKEGVIGQDTADAAHVIRLWGNDAAHGDLALEEFEEADGEEVVALMDEVLNRAYQSPARTARIKDSRERRKRGESGGVKDALQAPIRSGLG